MIQVRQELLAALKAAVTEIAPTASLELGFESPKQAAHGDLACTVVMPLAKALKKNPRELAESLVGSLRAQPAVQRWVTALEIAGPGFINLRLSDAARQSVVSEVLSLKDRFGCKTAQAAYAAEPKVVVEFVSANPTGPLHTGHTRQAALGDAICNVLASQGLQVAREFYYNDAGVQIATLAASVQARLKGFAPGDEGWPENAYNGEYIADAAEAFKQKQTVRADDRSTTASGDVNDLDNIRQFAVAYLRHEQDQDLQALGVKFDCYYLESSLYTEGRVEDTVKRLIAAGKTYESEGALWLRTTDDGDDKDRVMRKSDGTYTYFVPDVAYHLSKFERGYTRAINIQGGDHHGTMARVRAGIQGVGAVGGLSIPKGYPDYVLHKMVTVMKDGAEVKISKRAGGYVTLRDLIDWTSRDAVRFFMLSRKADTEFVFDVDLALKRNDENPVFYVQYAHARICSVIGQFVDKGGLLDGIEEAALSPLTAPSELALMRKLAEFPVVLTAAAQNLSPHDVAFYVRDVAASFHSYYAAERFLVDEPELARARLALLCATRQIIANALAVLGVSAPQRMDREPSQNPDQT
jgi:arginyl-tRNA synthetase